MMSRGNIEYDSRSMNLFLIGLPIISIKGSSKPSFQTKSFKDYYELRIEELIKKKKQNIWFFGRLEMGLEPLCGGFSGV